MQTIGGMLQGSQAGEDVGLERMFAVAARSEGATCAQVLRVARSVQLQASIAKQARRAQAIAILKKFDSGPGREAAQAVATALCMEPDIAMAGFPSSSGSGVHFAGCTDRGLIAAMSTLSSGDRRYPVTAALEQVWDCAHQMVTDANAPNLDDAIVQGSKYLEGRHALVHTSRTPTKTASDQAD